MRDTIKLTALRIWKTSETFTALAILTFTCWAFLAR